MKKKITVLALLLVGFFPDAKAQQKEVNGIVSLKESGELLDYVVVWVKGTHQGMVTGRDGHFNLDVNEGDTLEFSAKGYKTIELVVGSASLYKAELEPDRAGAKKQIAVSSYNPRSNAKQD